MKNTFTVICTNPARSASCPACEFDLQEWDEADAMATFAFDNELEISDVAIELSHDE